MLSRPRLTRRGLLLAGVGCAGAAAATGGYLRRAPGATGLSVVLAGGTPSGVYDHYARAWSELAGADGVVLRVWPSSGSVENLDLLDSGAADLAFCALDAAAQASSGASSGGIRALGRLYDDYMHLVVPAASPVTSIGDLRGRRVCVGAQRSGTALITERLLAVCGLNPARDLTAVQLSLDDSVTRLRAGAIDALFWSGGLPTQAIATLAAQRVGAGAGLRLIDLSSPARQLRRRYGTTYRIGAVPGRTYPGLPAAVATLAVPNVLLTGRDLTEADGERLIRLLFQDAPGIARTVPVAAQLDRQQAVFTEPTPLHPGAIAYYRSVATDIDVD